MIWTEFFDITTEPDGVPDLRPGDRKVHPERGRSLHPVGFELDNKQLAITFANKYGATHLRFYTRDGRYEYLRRGAGSSWRESDAETFYNELGLVEP